MTEREATKKTGRRALPIILIVLATIVGVVSVFALWAKRQLLETDTWSTTSEELIQNAEIQDALSTFIVTAIYDNVDVDAAIAERLPPELAPLAGPDRRSASQRRRRRHPEGARAAEGPAALGRCERGGAEQVDRPDRGQGRVRLDHRRRGHARPQVACWSR